MSGNGHKSGKQAEDARANTLAKWALHRSNAQGLFAGPVPPLFLSPAIAGSFPSATTGIIGTGPRRACLFLISLSSIWGWIFASPIITLCFFDSHFWYRKLPVAGTRSELDGVLPVNLAEWNFWDLLKDSDPHRALCLGSSSFSWCFWCMTLPQKITVSFLIVGLAVENSNKSGREGESE